MAIVKLTIAEARAVSAIIEEQALDERLGDKSGLLSVLAAAFDEALNTAATTQGKQGRITIHITDKE